MKKISIYSLLILLGLTVVFNACKKDDFTEKDAINLINDRDVNDAMIADSIANAVYFSVKVVDASADFFDKSAKSLTGVTVTVSSEGQVIPATTGADGIAYFNNLRKGSFAVTVSATGYTTVDFVAKASEKGYYSVQVPVLATTGSSMMTITGTVTYEGNLTTTAREPVADKPVLFTPILTGFFSSASTQGITSVAYSGFATTTNTNGSGVYTLALPADKKGDISYKVSVPDFEVDQTLLMNTVNNVTVTGWQNNATTSAQTAIKARFGTSAPSSSTVPTVSPVFAKFSDPNAITPATFGVQIYNQNGIESVNVTKAGEGYDNQNFLIHVKNTTDQNYATLRPVIDPSTGRVLSVGINAGEQGLNIPSTTTLAKLPANAVTIDATANVVGGAIISITVSAANQRKVFFNKKDNYSISISSTAGTGAVCSGLLTSMGWDNTTTDKSTYYGNIVTGATFSNGGTGYVQGDAVTITIAAVQTECEFNLNKTTGQVQNVSVLTTGDGYPKNKSDFKVKFNSGNAVATASSDANGKIYAVSITSKGSGYVTAPTATLDFVNTAALGTVTVNTTTGEVSSVTVSNSSANNGYTNPTVDFYNQVTGAKITDILSVITLSGSAVNAVTITNPGAGKYFGNVPQRGADGEKTVKCVPGATSLQNFDLGTGFRTINN